MSIAGTYQEINRDLTRWATAPDANDDVDADELWRAFSAAALGPDAARFWRAITQEYALQFLSLEGFDARDDEELRRLLDSGRDWVVGDSNNAHWRALRVAVGEADEQTESAFWDDFLADDVLRSARAAAVVTPAIARRDPRFIARLSELQTALPLHDAKRDHIERLLESGERR
ncbi:MAG: hypothetical protein M3N13_04585 [Candidatus Eremiobacteraeota bacterium]|nr:hypothetical protein [Candidatus Eremiobacteraeota bacterium]